MSRDKTVRVKVRLELEGLPVSEVETAAPADARLLDVIASSLHGHTDRAAAVIVLREDRARRVSQSIAIDVGGLFWWLATPAGAPPEQVRLADLQRSTTAGFVKPDSMIVLVVRDPIAAFIPPFEALVDYLETAGGVAGGLSAVAWVMRKIRRSFVRFGARRMVRTEEDIEWLKGFLRDHEDQWVARGGDTVSVLGTIIGRRSWDSAVLRNGLYIRSDEADRILRIMGYRYSPSSKRHILSGRAADLTSRKEIVRRLPMLEDPYAKNPS